MLYTGRMAYREIAGLEDVDFTFTEGAGPRADDDPKEVLIVGLTQCGVCHKVEKVLKEKGVAFGYVDLDTLPQAVRGPFLRGLKDMVPPRGLIFPVLITAQGGFVVGFQPDKWSEAGVEISIEEMK